MNWFELFIIGLFFSYLGSIPPGTLNISVLQLGMQNKKKAALYFAAAAAIVEFFYASFAVKFQMFLQSYSSITEVFHLVSAVVMLLLGVINLTTSGRKINKQETQSDYKNGFRRGFLLSLANPLAIPFWLAVTGYLQTNQFIALSDHNFLIYIAGISCGTFLLLASIVYPATKFSLILNNKIVVYRIPGLIFLGMSGYTFYHGFLI